MQMDKQTPIAAEDQIGAINKSNLDSLYKQF